MHVRVRKWKVPINSNLSFMVGYDFFLFLKSKENDPNRLFLNRGGALLKEMKTRNTVQKGLPKVKIIQSLA